MFHPRRHADGRAPGWRAGSRHRFGRDAAHQVCGDGLEPRTSATTWRRRCISQSTDVPARSGSTFRSTSRPRRSTTDRRCVALIPQNSTLRPTRTLLRPSPRRSTRLISPERPMLLIGNGIRLSRAEAEMEQLLRALDIPVEVTWLAIDIWQTTIRCTWAGPEPSRSVAPTLRFRTATTFSRLGRARTASSPAFRQPALLARPIR